MKRLLNFALLSCLLLQSVDGADADFKKGQAFIADAIGKISAPDVKVFLYSLVPSASREFPENSAKSFHRFPILGSVEIIPEQEKTNLLGSLAQGVRESDGSPMDCFEPRHGLRIVSQSTTNDFVICFSCRQIEAYGFSVSSYFLTANSPRLIFNKILDKYKLKKAR